MQQTAPSVPGGAALIGQKALAFVTVAQKFGLHGRRCTFGKNRAFPEKMAPVQYSFPAVRWGASSVKIEKLAGKQWEKVSLWNSSPKSS